MGILKRAADLAYTFRFIRMLVMKWESWDAYKLGIIDENGKRDKTVKLDDDEKKSAYTPFIRLAANIKRLLQKVPGGGTKLGSFAAALFLIKEKYGRFNVDVLDILNESNEWFVLNDKQLSPGVYSIRENKILNSSYEELCYAKDKIKVREDSYPVGDVFGLDIYEGTHIKTNQKIYFTISEIYK